MKTLQVGARLAEFLIFVKTNKHWLGSIECRYIPLCPSDISPNLGENYKKYCRTTPLIRGEL